MQKPKVPKSVSDRARARAARLADRGYPLKGNRRLTPDSAFGEGELGTYANVKDIKPKGGELAAVDAATRKRRKGK